jgi:S1-C subfamily serine protease
MTLAFSQHGRLMTAADVIVRRRLFTGAWLCLMQLSALAWPIAAGAQADIQQAPGAREGAGTEQAGAGPSRPALMTTQIDRATVRLFGIAGVDVAIMKGKLAKYQVAVPVAGHGSGVIVSPDGLILTANHVVDGVAHLAVQLPGGEAVHPARVVYTDEELDCAWVAIDTPTPDYLTIPTDVRPVQMRETVYAIGYPLYAARAFPSSSRGIIGGLDEAGNFQLDIGVNPGNSGGPVVDEQQALLGIIVKRSNPRMGVENIGIAVPVGRIAPAYQRALAERRKATGTPASETAQPIAELVAALVREDAVLGMFKGTKELIGREKSDALRARMQQLLTGAAAQEPYALAISAALEWNYAILLHEEGGAWRPHWEKAASLAYQAGLADDALVRGSRFVRVARRRHYVLNGIAPPPVVLLPLENESESYGPSASRPRR